MRTLTENDLAIYCNDLQKIKNCCEERDCSCWGCCKELLTYVSRLQQTIKTIMMKKKTEMKVCPYCNAEVIVKREGDEYFNWCPDCGRCLEGQALAHTGEGD